MLPKRKLRGGSGRWIWEVDLGGGSGRWIWEVAQVDGRDSLEVAVKLACRLRPEPSASAVGNPILVQL